MNSLLLVCEQNRYLFHLATLFKPLIKIIFESVIPDEVLKARVQKTKRVLKWLFGKIVEYFVDQSVAVHFNLSVKNVFAVYDPVYLPIFDSMFDIICWFHGKLFFILS